MRRSLSGQGEKVKSYEYRHWWGGLRQSQARGIGAGLLAPLLTLPLQISFSEKPCWLVHSLKNVSIQFRGCRARGAGSIVLGIWEDDQADMNDGTSFPRKEKHTGRAQVPTQAQECVVGVQYPVRCLGKRCST